MRERGGRGGGGRLPPQAPPAWAHTLTPLSRTHTHSRPQNTHRLVQTLATAFVMSWSGVIRIHGIRPSPRPGQSAGVFVANHSSMNDFILLLQSHPYAVVGQKHAGWVGFLQRNLLSCMNCVWFDRGAEDDKRKAAEVLKQHVQNKENAVTPALIFPEGTCVNNEYVVQVRGGRVPPPFVGSAAAALHPPPPPPL